MKINHIISILATALVAGACSPRIGEFREAAPIRLGVTIQESVVVGAATRAGTAVQGAELANGEPVDVYITNAWSSEVIAAPLQCTVTGDSGDLTSSATAYYPVDGADVDIYAVHPRHMSGSAFTVAYDQTADADYRVSDLCFSKTARYAFSTSAHSLPMRHLMAKIVVEVNVPPALGTGSLSATNLKVHAKRSVVANFPEANADGYSFGALADEGDVAFDVGGAALIPPQTVAAGTAFITLTVPGVGPYAYLLPADQTFEPGHQYTFTVSPTGNSLSFATAEVIHPMDGGTFSNPLTQSGNAPVVYSSSNTAVATVNAATGVVTPVGSGSVTITATVASGHDSSYTTRSASYTAWIGEYNPLYFVADYYLNSSKTFDTVQSEDQGYLWKQSTMMKTKFAAQTSSYDGYRVPTGEHNIGGVPYHMPTAQEWRSIFPWTSSGVYDSNTPANQVLTEGVCVFGSDSDSKTAKQYKSYWSTFSSGSPRYAIRFLGERYCSVWRYRYAGSSGTNYHLEITAVLIDPIGASETSKLSTMMTSLRNGTFTWPTADNRSTGAYIRKFYVTGYINAGEGKSGKTGKSTDGFCPSTTTDPSDATSSMGPRFDLGNAGRMNTASSNNGRPIRLFRDY